MKKAIAISSVVLGVVFPWAGPARAASPWTERAIVLPYHNWAFDVGLGIGHCCSPGFTGPGLNLEGAVGVTERLQLGLRTGLRFGDEAKITGADAYGRMFDRETYNIGGEALSNPEFLIRYGLLGERVIELGLEGRMYLPTASGSHFGVLFGLPLAFHFSPTVRLDTGVYIPVIFNDPRTYVAFSIPAHLWFQASNQVWLGPMSGVRFNNPGGDAGNTEVPLGFGLGYQIASAVDFKTEFLFPHINLNNGARDWGISAGFQFRIE